MYKWHSRVQNLGVLSTRRPNLWIHSSPQSGIILNAYVSCWLGIRVGSALKLNRTLSHRFAASSGHVHKCHSSLKRLQKVPCRMQLAVVEIVLVSRVPEEGTHGPGSVCRQDQSRSYTRHGAEISVRFPQLLACQASSALHQLVSVRSVEKKLDTPLPAASCHPFPTLRVPSIPPHPPQPVRSLISIQQPHNTPRPPPGPKAPSPHRKTLTTTPTFNNNRISLARLAQSVERETLKESPSSQGCGFDPHVGLNSRSSIGLYLFRSLFLLPPFSSSLPLSFSRPPCFIHIFRGLSSLCTLKTSSLAGSLRTCHCSNLCRPSAMAVQTKIGR